MNKKDSPLILVVDDDDLTRMHLCELLAEAGYQVAEASNGLEALATYIRLHPDMVLLDAVMPVMNGFTCCAQLRSLTDAKDIPVLMITALYDQISMEQAFSVGATDFITKPIQWPILCQRLRRLLEAHQAMQELKRQTKQAQLRETQLRMALDAARMSIWNWDLLTNQITCSDNLDTVFGLGKGAFNYRYTDFINLVHPQDRDRISRAHQQAIRDGLEYDIEFRLILPSGNIRWLASKGLVFRDASGVVVRMSSVDMDITKRKQAEEAREVHANQQAVVAELSQMALADTDLTKLMNSYVNIVSQCLQVPSCKVLEILPDNNGFLVRAKANWQQEFREHETLDNQFYSPTDQTPCSPEPTIVDDLSQVVSGMSVIIHGKDNPFGVLTAHTTKQRTFTKDDIYFLQAVANVLATAIERQRVEDALKNSEERCQLALRGNNDGIWDWNIKTNEVFFSTRWKEMLGYTDHEISDHLDEWVTRVHPDDIASVKQAIADHFAQKTPFYIHEHRVRCQDNTYKWILHRGQAVWDEDDNVVRMTSSHTDITKRKLAEEQLRQSEERFQIVARATNDAIWDWDLQSNRICWNQAIQTLFGYPLNEVNADASWWWELIHPDDRHRLATDINVVINSREKFWSNEYRFRRRDGSYAYIFDRSYVIYDQTKQAVRMIGAMMDISQQKRSQAELEWQNLRSQLFADVTLKIRQSLQIDEILQTSVIEVQKLLHADRVLILRLRSTGSLIAVQEAVVPGLPVVLGLEITDPCFEEDYIQKYRQGGISAITDIEQAQIQLCHLKFLQKLAVKANLVVPILLKDQQLWGLLIAHQCARQREWTAWEIELLQQLANQIGIALAQSLILKQETRQRQELARSNEELQQFAFVASHDLQEPLRKIRLFGDRLKATCGENFTAQGHDYLERMQNAALRMQTLIEDLLTLSRVTTRAQPFVPVNLVLIAQEVLSDLEVLIQQTKARVQIGELPTITADPLQMRQLLQNLIGNALKFHHPEVLPIIKISSQFLINQSDKVSVACELCQIIIEDNGIGFEEKYLDRIFNVFQRLHTRREYEGTGIGLAICRKIIERHHGTITAQSKLGEGARFIVTLPLTSLP